MESLKWLFLVEVFATAAKNTTAEGTICHTSKAIIGQSAFVSCHVAHVPIDKKQTLRLLRHDYEHPWTTPTPEMILKCTWLPNSNTPTCSTNPGYTFNVSSSNTVTTTIQRTTKKHTGVYVCTDKLSDGTTEDAFCKLYVRDAVIRCDAAELQEGETGTITCHFNSDLNKTKDGFHVYYIRPGSKEKIQITSCAWAGRDKEKIACTSCRDSYRCKQRIPTQAFSVEIPLAHTSHSGKYYCDIIPSDYRVTVNGCALKVSGETTREQTSHYPTTQPPTTPAGETTCEQTSHYPTTQPPTTPAGETTREQISHDPTTQPTTTPETQETMSKRTLAAIVVASIVVLSITAFILCVKLRQWYNRRSSNS